MIKSTKRSVIDFQGVRRCAQRKVGLWRSGAADRPSRSQSRFCCRREHCINFVFFSPSLSHFLLILYAIRQSKAILVLLIYFAWGVWHNTKWMGPAFAKVGLNVSTFQLGLLNSREFIPLEIFPEKFPEIFPSWE